MLRANTTRGRLSLSTGSRHEATAGSFGIRRLGRFPGFGTTTTGVEAGCGASASSFPATRKVHPIARRGTVHGMALTIACVERLADDYRRREPLHAVEAERMAGLPRAFSRGEFGRRDVQWVVWWYHRRDLATPHDADRRAAEAAFDDNAFTEVRAAIEAVTASEDDRHRLERLLDLRGVDVPVATAILMYVDPTAYLVLDRRAWPVLAAEIGLPSDYPSSPTVEDALAYLAAAREGAAELGVDLPDLYRALRRLGDG